MSDTLIGAAFADIIDRRFFAAPAVTSIRIIVMPGERKWVVSSRLDVDGGAASDHRETMILLPRLERARLTRLQARGQGGQEYKLRRYWKLASCSTREPQGEPWVLECELELEVDPLSCVQGLSGHPHALAAFVPRIVGAAADGRKQPSISLSVSNCAVVDTFYIAGTPLDLCSEGRPTQVIDAALSCAMASCEFQPSANLTLVTRGPISDALRQGFERKYVPLVLDIFDVLRDLYEVDVNARLCVEVLGDGVPPARTTGPVIETGQWLSRSDESSPNPVAVTAQLNQLWLGTTARLIGKNAAEARLGIGEGIGLYILKLLKQNALLSHQLTRYTRAAKRSLLTTLSVTSKASRTSRIALGMYEALVSEELSVLAFPNIARKHGGHYVTADTLLGCLEEEGFRNTSALI